MIVGMLFLGVSCALIFVPLLSEIIDAVQEKENMGENEDLNDMASGMFNSSYAIGCLIAPILGGFLNDQVGFRRTCDFMAFGAVVFMFLYFAVNVLPFLI